MKRLLVKIWKLLSLPTTLQLALMRLTQDQFLIGVTGIFFNQNNEILLVKHTYRGNSWSLPGGYIKAKEHPREALEREVEEESGFIVSCEERLSIRTDRESARLDICYMGSFIGGEFKPSHEVSQASLFSFDQLPLITKDQLLFINKALEKRKQYQVVDNFIFTPPVSKKPNFLLKFRYFLSGKRN